MLPINDDMLIGLRFLQYSISGLILTEQGYHDNVPYISEVQKKIPILLTNKNYRI